MTIWVGIARWEERGQTSFLRAAQREMGHWGMDMAVYYAPLHYSTSQLYSLLRSFHHHQTGITYGSSAGRDEDVFIGGQFLSIRPSAKCQLTIVACIFREIAYRARQLERPTKRKEKKDY
ncbi:hypothetical protein IF2G_09571 [Cordyceps javanica]|nr:hypothetical protein IF2G_09571 [Cordyceps javanica]